MHIYFLRHGIAEDGAIGGDSARALTAAGALQMQTEARGMKRLGVKIDVLLTSPLVRARQTAAIVAEALGHQAISEPLLASGMAPQGLSPLLARYSGQRIMIVGHEPDLSSAISWMIGGGSINMKKGALALVELPEDQELDGTLLWLAAPKLLRTIGES
jgi:phosphohistidine phosphatase